ncbi:MAG: DUF1868 domain-containing protein [Pseudomonadota bacterium]
MTKDIREAMRRAADTHDQWRVTHKGTRFDDRGRFLPEPGNTVVCHLDAGSSSEAAVIAARAQCKTLPEADRLTFTPIPSLHMTLFQGVIEYRRHAPYWPQDMALDTPIERMTEHYLARLDGFQPGAAFRMRATALSPTGLTLQGAEPADIRALSDWRNRLADVFGYRHPDHDSYRFHVTFAYLVEPMSEEAKAVWAEEVPKILTELVAAAPIIDLMPPAFCAFEDMEFFDELLVLGDQGG